MRTRGEIKTKLTPMLFAVSTSTYFTPTRVETAISDAYLWVVDQKPWPDVKKGFIFDTSGDEYYDYPTNCQSESVFRISIGGDSAYKKKDFEDFLAFREQYPTSTEKFFSEYGRQIFITPVPALVAEGTHNGILWGLIQAAALDNDADITLFTDWADSVNEAILLKAYHDLTLNVDANKANDALAKSGAIVNMAYGKIAKRQQRKQRISKPMFDVPDFFATGVNSSNIGNFSLEED